MLMFTGHRRFSLPPIFGFAPSPQPRACGAENGDCAERQKDRAENSVIRRPRDDRAEQRQDGKQNEAACSLGVHSYPD
jgi:hypothetical protein